MDAIWAAYCEISEVLVNSKSLKNGLGCDSLDVQIYGSTVNGLFDVPRKGAKVNSADLDLTVFANGTNKSRQEILKQIRSKLKNKNTKFGKGKIIEQIDPLI